MRETGCWIRELNTQNVDIHLLTNCLLRANWSTTTAQKSLKELYPNITLIWQVIRHMEVTFQDQHQYRAAPYFTI